ncbi:MAG TPA: TIGR04282 family arsenosugar biosynthesis glycosyltransferase [Acidobacteriota bacterium]|nr:TIGR04282 family arsenosugar biosynthesis glycosyltransferase [Acidobacteriota bacterium]
MKEGASVAVFAKAPVAGRVKTRLVPPLTHPEAAAIARACLEETLGRFPARVPAAWTLFLDGAPDEALRAVAARAGVAIAPQGEGDLGARLERAFRRLREEGARRVVAIGADSPTLPPERIAEALEALRRSDAVIGPAEDGGYYLVGLSRDAGDLFRETPWGTGDVARVAAERARARGLGLERLPEWYDVDDAASLRRLANEARAGEYPALARVIAEIGSARLAAPL